MGVEELEVERLERFVVRLAVGAQRRALAVDEVVVEGQPHRLDAVDAQLDREPADEGRLARGGGPGDQHQAHALGAGGDGVGDLRRSSSRGTPRRCGSRRRSRRTGTAGSASRRWRRPAPRSTAGSRGRLANSLGCGCRGCRWAGSPLRGKRSSRPSSYGTSAKPRTRPVEGAIGAVRDVDERPAARRAGTVEERWVASSASLTVLAARAEHRLGLLERHGPAREAGGPRRRSRPSGARARPPSGA